MEAIGETLPGYEVTTWYALVAPSGTPPAAIERLNSEVAAIVEEPSFRVRLRDEGVQSRTMTPAELSKLFADDGRRLSKLLRETKAAPR